MICLTPEERARLTASGLIAHHDPRPTAAQIRSERRRQLRNAQKAREARVRAEARRLAKEEQDRLALEARQRREATIVRRDESARVDAKINALVNRRLLQLDPYRLAR